MARIADGTLWALLADDAPHGDLTSDGLPLAGAQGRVHFGARQPMVASGVEEAVRLFELAGAIARATVASGSAVDAGAPLLEAEGAARPLLLAWKTAQTLVEAMGGIATAPARSCRRWHRPAARVRWPARARTFPAPAPSRRAR